jgi:hypothetical protein
MKTRLPLLLMIMVTIAGQAILCNTSDPTELSNTDKSGQNINQPQQKAFTTEAYYTVDICANMADGIKTGTKYRRFSRLLPWE